MLPDGEARELFYEVISILRRKGSDLKSVLRSCQLACYLVKNEKDATWIGHELAGYPDGVEVPTYRKISGMAITRTTKMGPTQPGLRVFNRGAPPVQAVKEQSGTATLDFTGGIVALQRLADTGLRQETPVALDDGRREGSLWEREEIFERGEFLRIIEAIEQEIYQFASRSYADLRYGSPLTNVWQERRQLIDIVLREIGMSNHLTAMEAGVESDNPEIRRTAVFGCRNLLADLAAHLWRDPRPTYAHLSARKGGELDVGRDKYLNRLAAYLHQKGQTGTLGGLIRDELEQLAISLRSLNEAQSSAHAPIDPEDARSIILLTYVILGELVSRTDMQPVASW